MPVYEFTCAGRCGTIEITKRMDDPSPTVCPECGRALTRVYNCFLQGSVDANQESENNGFGKFYPQLGPQFIDQKTKRIRNPAAHARSRYDAMEKVKRRGGVVEKT